MRSQKWRRLAAGVLFGLLATVAVAAGQPPEGKPPGARPGPRPPGARAGEVREAMEQMVIARMKVALHLTEKQEATVVPRAQQLMQVRRDHAAKRRAAMARLRALLLDETAGDREIGYALRDVRAINQDFRGKEEGLRDGIDQELTSRQQARMVFFEARLRRVMQRRLQDALDGGPGPGAGRGLAPTRGRRPDPVARPIEDDEQGPGTPENDL